MRYLIIAAALAVAAPLGLGATAAQADTKIVIKNGDRDMHRSHRSATRVVERRGPNCVSRKVVTRVHGERIVKTTRVCR